MPKLKLPDYKFKNIKEKSAESTINFITILVRSKYPEGIDGPYRRVFARIQEKFDEAIDKNTKTVEFELAELDLINNALKDGRMAAEFSKQVIMLEDAVMEAYKM